MKEIYMLIGFGAGLVTGVLLYRYSGGTKELVRKGEKAIIKEVEMVKQEMQNAQKQADKEVPKQENNKNKKQK